MTPANPFQQLADIAAERGSSLPLTASNWPGVRSGAGTLVEIEIDRISVGPRRHRQDMGDLQALADSMSEIGLLQPIGVTADFAMVFGERRLRAARMLGWTTIAARIVDLPSIVAGEYAENEVRKDFTPSERVAIAEVIRAEIGSRQGRRTDHPAHFWTAVHNFARRTPRLAARKAGFDRSQDYGWRRPSSSTALPTSSRRWTGRALDQRRRPCGESGSERRAIQLDGRGHPACGESGRHRSRSRCRRRGKPANDPVRPAPWCSLPMATTTRSLRRTRTGRARPGTSSASTSFTIFRPSIRPTRRLPFPRTCGTG